MLLTTYQFTRSRNAKTRHCRTYDKAPCPVLSPSLPVIQLQVFQMLLQWCGLHCRRRSNSTASGLRNCAQFLFCLTSVGWVNSGLILSLWNGDYFPLHCFAVFWVIIVSSKLCLRVFQTANCVTCGANHRT